MNKKYQTGERRARTGRAAPKKSSSSPEAASGEPDMNLPSWALPGSVQVAMADLAGAVREGLLAFAFGTGLQVLQVVMEEDVTALAGPKGGWNRARVAKRHGHDDGEVSLGGRRVPIRRPRVRSADGSKELALASYEAFSSTELLSEMALERMLAKLSCRRYPIGLEPVGAGVEQVAPPPRSPRSPAAS